MAGSGVGVNKTAWDCPSGPVPEPAICPASLIAWADDSVHPGAESIFEDIVIDGMFCSKPLQANPLAAHASIDLQMNGERAGSQARSQRRAFSKSPSVSCSARRASRMPAPVA